MKYSIMTLDPSAVIEVAYDGSVDAAPLHIWTDGAALCGSPVAVAVVFSSDPAAVVDIGCVHCERTLRARAASPAL